MADIELVGSDRALLMIDDLIEKTENPQSLMADIANFTQNKITESFNRQANFESKPWQKLKPATIKSLTSRGLWHGQILEATGVGRKSVKVILASSDIRVEYSRIMGYHNEGASKLPQRQFAPTDQDFVKGAFGSAIARLISNQLEK